MVAFGGGGWLADAYGWRTAFVIFGAPGLLLALLIRKTVSEPRRGAIDLPTGVAAPGGTHAANAISAVSLTRALRFLVSIPSLRTLVLASGLNAIGMYAVLVWAVPYMTRVHSLSTGAAGARLAIASGLFTALGTLVGGRIADRLALRDMRWLAWLPALTSALVVPFGWGFAFAPNATSASLLLAPASFLAGSYFGPMYSAVQTLAAPQTRALAGASVTIVNTLLGLGIAPPLVGWLNDVGTASYGIEAIRYSLGAIFVAHLGAAALFLRAAPTLRRDLDAKRRFLASNP
jgi:predicted MFS family arabinose efflux permease